MTDLMKYPVRVGRRSGYYVCRSKWVTDHSNGSNGRPIDLLCWEKKLGKIWESFGELFCELFFFRRCGKSS